MKCSELCISHKCLNLYSVDTLRHSQLGGEQICHLRPGKHDNKAAIDRQVNDKERVCAAMENEDVRGAIEDLIKERPVH